MYGLLVLAASTAEIVGTVGVAFRTYMTEATATSATAMRVTPRSAFLIMSYCTNVATLCKWLTPPLGRARLCERRLQRVVMF